MPEKRKRRYSPANKKPKKEKETVHNLKQEEEKGYDSPEKKTSNN
jgi:hypothetical protein